MGGRAGRLPASGTRSRLCGGLNSDPFPPSEHRPSVSRLRWGASRTPRLGQVWPTSVPGLPEVTQTAPWPPGLTQGAQGPGAALGSRSPGCTDSSGLPSGRVPWTRPPARPEALPLAASCGGRSAWTRRCGSCSSSWASSSERDKVSRAQVAPRRGAGGVSGPRCGPGAEPGRSVQPQGFLQPEPGAWAGSVGRRDERRLSVRRPQGQVHRVLLGTWGPHHEGLPRGGDGVGPRVALLCAAHCTPTSAPQGGQPPQAREAVLPSAGGVGHRRGIISQ